MAFNSLPIELNEHIAGYLPTDQDVVNFFGVCNATYQVGESVRCGIWRKLFSHKFDTPADVRGQELKAKYKHWCRILRRHTNWQTGREPNEMKVLEALLEMVLGAYTNLPLRHKADQISNNLIALRRYVHTSNILDNVLNAKCRDRTFNPRLKTLQLVFTYLQLDVSVPPVINAFTYSQKAVYGHPSKYPMFKGKNCTKIDIDFILHTANFFKYHMTKSNVHTLYELFSGLEDHEKPQAWDSMLYQGPGVTRLGRHWLGSYAYLPETQDMRDIRSTPTNAMLFTDCIDYQDGFQTLDLDFSATANCGPWPKTYESHLKGIPPVGLCKQLDKLQKTTPAFNVRSSLRQGPSPETMLETPPPSPDVVRQTTTYPVGKILPLSAPLTSPKRGTHYRQFSGSGNDADTFYCHGILHPLPPQHGIPGWQRITMMKDYKKAATRPTHAASHVSSSASEPSSTASSPPWSLAFTDTSPTPSQSPNATFKATQWPYPVDREESSSSTATAAADFTHAPPEDDADVDNQCWAYEGVVLPGGKIILGRWWSPVQEGEDEMICMGPFIFWEVGRS